MVFTIRQHKNSIRCTNVLSLLNPPFTPPHPTPLDYHRALGLGSLYHTANSYRLSILRKVMYRFQCYLLM